VREDKKEGEYQSRREKERERRKNGFLLIKDLKGEGHKENMR